MPADFSAHMISFFLVAARILAFFAAAPFFGSTSVPVMIKTFFAILVAYFVYHSPEMKPVTEIPDFMHLSFLLLKEISVGLVLTFIAQMIYMPLRVVGVELGNIGGFGQDAVFKLEDESNFTALQQLFNVIAILLFFAFEGHHLMLNLIVSTFQFVPVGGITFDAKILRVCADYFCRAFTQGIVIVAPIMGCVLLCSISFGLLSKSVPEMNLLVLDLPLRIFIALFAIVFSLPMISVVFKKFLNYTMNNMELLTMIMSGQGK